MFSTIVPAFEPENMKTVLALVITAFAYMTFGLIFGFIIRALTPVPRGWSGGVLATGAFCNWGDLPLAFIGTIAKNAPFNGDKDVASGTAYTSIFMVAQMFVVYNLGGIQLVAHDFREREIKDLESAPTTDKALRRSVARVVEKTRRVVGPKSAAADPVSPSCGRCEGKESAAPSTIPSPCESCATSSSPTPASSNPPSVRRTMRQRVHGWIAPFITPASLSLVLGLVVANVRQLKALFVPVLPAVMPNAPDDKPPLDFLMEICSFGGDTVPVIGMVLLGAALSRLSITTLPKGFWKSVGCMALLKLGLGKCAGVGGGDEGMKADAGEGSVIGVLWSGMMVQKTGLVDEGDKMLQCVIPDVSPRPAGWVRGVEGVGRGG